MNPNVKKTGFNLAYVLLAAMGVLLLQDWWIRSQAVATIPYSEFQEAVQENRHQLQRRRHDRFCDSRRGTALPPGSARRLSAGLPEA